jgi:pyruvate/2-oxoglutarate/acetoin dehydrogenase E1 component
LPHQEDNGDLAIEIMRERMTRETRAHLRDIAREHGKGRHWANLAIPQGAPRFIDRPLTHSAFGSAGAMCAAQGERRVVAILSY